MLLIRLLKQCLINVVTGSVHLFLDKYIIIEQLFISKLLILTNVFPTNSFINFSKNTDLSQF
jgi:hypothetical protein